VAELERQTEEEREKMERELQATKGQSRVVRTGVEGASRDVSWVVRLRVVQLWIMRLWVMRLWVVQRWLLQPWVVQLCVMRLWEEKKQQQQQQQQQEHCVSCLLGAVQELENVMQREEHKCCDCGW